jgi:hypothetical protein
VSIDTFAPSLPKRVYLVEPIEACPHFDRMTAEVEMAGGIDGIVDPARLTLN